MEKEDNGLLGSTNVLTRPYSPFSILHAPFRTPATDNARRLMASGSVVPSRHGRRLAAALGAVLLLAEVTPAWAAESGVPKAESGILEALFFYVFAAATLLSGLMICLGKNVIRMAVGLFVVLGSVAMLYFLLGASFLAAIQFIVYVGGTLVLLIFGVMLTSRSPWMRLNIKPREALAAAAVGVVLLGTLVAAVRRAQWPEEIKAAPGFTVGELGRSLLTTYLVPFEVVSVLLLTVMIGAAYLARQEK
ncbi:MAG: NADH-quinone oxidoreductase subunit J [Planctomycetota bacterium]